MTPDETVAKIARETIYSHAEAKRFVDGAVEAKVSMDMAFYIARRASGARGALPDLAQIWRSTLQEWPL